ncbi:MAG: type 1 periplasmic-binding domain-containing protein [Mycobacteriales bacterium]
MTRLRRKGRHSFAGLVLVALVTACGSTVATSASTPSLTGGAAGGPGQAAAGLGPVSSGPSGSAGAGIATGAGGAVTVGATGATGGTGGRGSTGNSGTAGGGASGALPATGPGWDKKYVYFGVVEQTDEQTAFAALGFAGVNPGNTAAQATAVANYINERGGVFGRQIKLVFQDEKTVQTAENPDTAGAAACAEFTQDRPVVAVLSIVTVMDVQSWRSCMARGKVPLFSATLNAVDNQALQSLAPYFYMSQGVSWNPLAPVLVSQLKAQGWFGGWNTATGGPAPGSAKVGILVDGTTVGSGVGATISQALAQAGYGGALVYQYSDPTNLQPAVLYFSGHGVNHVIVADIQLLAFQLDANSQHYYPRYGVNTYNAPLNNLQTFSPAGQNNGALGVGWVPALDVSDANDPGITGPGEATCLAIMAKGGQTFSGERLARSYAFAMCDAMLLTTEGAVAGGGLSGVDIHRGILRIASSFSSAIGFANGLGPSQYFIPGAVRGLAWYPSCTCFRYTTAPTQL